MATNRIETLDPALIRPGKYTSISNTFTNKNEKRCDCLCINHPFIVFIYILF